MNERVDDLIAALVLLQLDLGLGRLQELHRAGHLDGGNTLAIFVHRRMNRLHLTGEVATGGRPVIRFDLHRAQRYQLAIQAARAVLRRESLVRIAHDEGQLRVVAHIHIRLLETEHPLGEQDASRLVRVDAVSIPVDADGPSCCHCFFSLYDIEI